MQYPKKAQASIGIIQRALFDKRSEKSSYSIYFFGSPGKLTFMWRSTYLINKGDCRQNVNRMLTNILKFPL